jgi:methionyl-tRNA formyltransferase
VSDYRSLREPATRAGLPFLSFVSVNEPAVRRFLAAHAPDLLWVIGLSQLVPDDLIRIARHGGVGFHPTLLPRGRGRAPVAWTILLGEPAAVSLFFLTDQPDAGDLIVQREVPVLPDDYSEDLIRRTNEMLSTVVLQLAPLLRAGALPRTPQDNRDATYYPKRTPADGLIDWSRPTDEIFRLVRAAGRPYPGAFAYIGRHKVTVWRARPGSRKDLDSAGWAAECGTISRVDSRGNKLARTADGGLWLTEVTVEEVGNTSARGLLEVGAKLTAGMGEHGDRT